MRDSRGFLWFATRDGLSRFDGIRFVTYQVGKKDAPPGIEHAFETSKGIYWIGTTGGLYRYDPNSLPVKAKITTSEDRPSTPNTLTTGVVLFTKITLGEFGL